MTVGFVGVTVGVMVGFVGMMVLHSHYDSHL